MGATMITQDIAFKGTERLVLGDGVQTDSVKPTRLRHTSVGIC